MKQLIILSLFCSSFIINSNSWDNFYKKWSSQEGLGSASVSFSVYDLDKKEFLIAENSEKTLAPASTQKLITTAYALDRFGPNYKYKTMVFVDANIEGGIVDGNLYVEPNSNPCLANPNFKNSEVLFKKVKEFCGTHGIKSITGKVIVIDPLYKKETLPRTWIFEDIGNYFGANPTGTIYNENILKIQFETGSAGSLAKVINVNPKLPWLEVENRAVSKGSSDQAYAFSIPNSERIIVEGTLPENKKYFTIKASLPNPQKAFAFLLSQYLTNHKIVLGDKFDVVNEKPPMLKHIGTIASAPLSEIVKRTNMKSVNILAENLYQNNQKGLKDLIVGYKFPEKTAFGGGMDGIIMKDGSGLSRFNAVSSAHLINVLNYMDKHKHADSFKNSLPIAGKSGSLKYMFLGSDLANNLSAKSGYMQGVRSYAGYFRSKTGKRLAFAVIINNYTIKASAMKKQLEALILEASRY